jgi:hypothetical protein
MALAISLIIIGAILIWGAELLKFLLTTAFMLLAVCAVSFEALFIITIITTFFSKL